MYDHTSTLGHHIEIQGNDSFKLLKLNDIIQWTTLDQHRYAEALGVLPYLFTRNARRILIIGGGDGVIASTLLHYFSNTIEHITILDIDPEIVEVSRTFLDFPNDPKVRVISSDAITAIEGNRTDHYFDLIIGDIDNPSFSPAAPYYTVEFMRHINRTLKADGIFVTTCEAPVANPYAVACLSLTIREAFGRSNTASYHISMPYCPPPAARGFIITTDYPMQLPIPQSCRYLNPSSVNSLFTFGNDEICPDAKVSTRDNRLYSRLFVTPFAHTLDEVEVDLED